MQNPFVPMVIPHLSVNLTNVKFMSSDNKYYESCGQMANMFQKVGVTKSNCHIL